jgi:hypothetical protein
MKAKGITYSADVTLVNELLKALPDRMGKSAITRAMKASTAPTLSRAKMEIASKLATTRKGVVDYQDALIVKTKRYRSGTLVSFIGADFKKKAPTVNHPKRGHTIWGYLAHLFERGFNANGTRVAGTAPIQSAADAERPQIEARFRAEVKAELKKVAKRYSKKMAKAKK